MEKRNYSPQEKKYLVRKLKVIKGENSEIFSLYYVDIHEDRIIIKPFDRELAGYSYLESLSLSENRQGYLETVE